MSDSGASTDLSVPSLKMFYFCRLAFISSRTLCASFSTCSAFLITLSESLSLLLLSSSAFSSLAKVNNFAVSSASCFCSEVCGVVGVEVSAVASAVAGTWATGD